MKTWMLFLMLLSCSGVFVSCASNPPAAEQEEGDVAGEFEDEEDDELDGDSELSKDEDVADSGDDSDLDSEFEEEGEELEDSEVADESFDDEELEEVDESQVETAEAAEEPVPVEEPMKDEAPVPSTNQTNFSDVSDFGSSVAVTALNYQAEKDGGTVAITTSEPAKIRTRLNPSTQQFVVEILNASLPQRLTRPLLTKDFGGAIASVNAYQASDTSASRIVLQMRDNRRPNVEQAGNTILVSAEGSRGVVDSGPTYSDEKTAQALGESSLEEFLLTNNRFYGRKISIEVTDAKVVDVLNLIAEEAGINLVVDDEIKGTISTKLRNVPWDQALVIVLRSKKLAYQRQGSVIRVAPVAQLRSEANDVRALITEREQAQPLRVKVISVSYADVKGLEKQIAPFLSPRGKVASDERTTSIVVTDLPDNLDRVEKLIRTLDSPPPQVLIEGKVVEAQDTFAKDIGVNWGFSGEPLEVATRSSGSPVNLTQTLTINPTGAAVAQGGLNFNLNIGTLGLLGDLDARLALFEREAKVKIVSSPRVMTLTNVEAEISQSTEVPLIATVVQDTQPIRTVTFKNVQLNLKVKPQVTADDSILLNVTVTREFAGEIVDQETQARPINRRVAQTTVLVKNGQTAVLGGIYQSDATESVQGVPYLRNIPLIGKLFQSRSRTSAKNELLVFLTPRIIGEPISGELQ